MERNADELTLLLHCQNLPGTRSLGGTGLRLGIQRGQEVIEDALAEGEEIPFMVPMRVKRNTQTGVVDFSGPFVQGKVGERFVYLCWGEREGETWNGLRRAKLLLNHLDKRAIFKALDIGKPIEATIDMTDAKGGPVCASLREDAIQWRF